ncbi:ankyrin repeat and protein kinase domain-containing protein [Verticillium alfalfae VaMs.102]|uniref:Ankyrin repeat and protein kinase domain-containing protein n=1 Tax=Verticillium alfalfae (strain VaMs.102 / ATCC MYA-4576 / FGSC 10136) TaxID=526221 RepID=C9SYH2_VERA1|nr:ankyrin repeat and protein kinase domain-containing protein [Verticillium alfalfae VaMs.102]EEY23837.1 ankyrin repeat and protein kinase domain-containing protein [Verticillium alfalfae VaMs.102]
MESQSPMLEEVISSQPDDKETEEHVHQLLISLPSVFFTIDAQKRTPLHHAASAGKSNILRAILTVGPESEVDLQDAEGCTALHLAARNGHEAVARALLNVGADVRREEAFGETPLHEAARNGHAALVKLFIDSGAVVDVGNRDSSTALHVAARRGHSDVVEILLTAGANPATKDKVGDTPLHDAAREGRTDIVDALLNTGLVSVEARNANGLTPLSVGARHGRDGIVRSLLERGADVDAQSSEFCTPLHQAATEGHDGVARSLIAAGAEVDLQDKDLQSPLHTAVIFEHADVTRERLRSAMTGSRDVAPRRELLRASTAERTRRLSAMPTGLQHHLFPYLKHLDAMNSLRQSFTKSELHVPRTLDQSYHESLSKEEVRARNESQVLYRYLLRLESLVKAEKQKNDGSIVAGEQKSGQGSGNPFEHRELLEQHSDKQKRTDGTKEQLMRMAGRQDVASSVRARVARERKGIEQEQRKQVLMVSQLWMWRIDEHNIITCYPERWDDKNAKTLLNEIKHRVLASPGLKSADTDMMDIAAHVLESAVGFSEEEFHFQFCGPRSYCNVFAGSVAFLSNEAMKRYAAFKSSIRGMRTSKTVLGDLRAEIELLQEIDDVREEVNMIQTVLKEQERVVVEFQGSREPDCTVLEQVRGGLGGFSHPTLDFFDRLGLDADRVRTSREANIEEALSANEQSKILFIFTGATVVFKVGSLLATVLVIWLSLQIYELVAQGQSSAKRRKLDSMLRRKTQPTETLAPEATAQSQRGDESAGPASQTARSSALRSEAAASAVGQGASGQRKLRKRFIRFGRDGKKRLDEETAIVV